jgi:hypothetical protein
MRFGTHFHIFLHRSIRSTDACQSATPTTHCKNCDASLQTSLQQPMSGEWDFGWGEGIKSTRSLGFFLSPWSDQITTNSVAQTFPYVLGIALTDEKLPWFYATNRFIKVYTTVQHWASLLFISVRPILIQRKLWRCDISLWKTSHLLTPLSV